MLNYTLALLYDDGLGMLKHLTRCRSCKKFFIKSDERRRFCTDSCMRQATREGTRERVAASREGMTVKQYRAQNRRKK